MTMADDHHKRDLLVKQLLPSKTSLGSLDWVVTLVKENVPDRKTIYSGRCNPLILSCCANMGNFHTGTLGCSMSSPALTGTNRPSGNPGTSHQIYRGDMEWSQMLTLHCQSSAWPWQGSTHSLGPKQGPRGLSWKHRCTIPNGAQGLQSHFTTLNRNTKSLTQLSFL